MIGNGRSERPAPMGVDDQDVPGGRQARQRYPPPVGVSNRLGADCFDYSVRLSQWAGTLFPLTRCTTCDPFMSQTSVAPDGCCQSRSVRPSPS